MKKLIILKVFILLAFSLLNATIIHIPADYPAIQEGINASVDGDTVLVADGIYYENLSIDREITLASHFIIDGNISHRDATIIDGGNYDEDSGPFGSCVLFRPPENGDAISPKLTGFTIQHGLGTRVRDIIDPDEDPVIYYMGGGLMIWYTLPEITYNYIRDNGSNSDTRAGSTKRGGASGLNTDDDVEFDEDRGEPYDRTFLTRDDEIIFSNNIFENNDSETGNTFESIGYVGDIDFSSSVFDVFCSYYTDVSEYWVVEGEANSDFTGGSGELEAITDDVWVSPDGVDETITTGTDQDPFKTIDYAMSRIYVTASNGSTINLTGETFSPSTTGEEFPIIMISNVNLIGQGEEATIIDAMQSDRVITMDNCQNNIISDLTIANGLAEGESSNRGGGMALSFSNPILHHVTIADNHAYNGGGMALYFSNPILNHLTITGNTATASGGILLYHSNPTLNNVIITNNTVMGDGEWEGYGGGMAIGHSNPILNNVTISENTSNEGGGIHLTDYNPFAEASTPEINNSIIWGNSPESIFTGNYGTPVISYSDIEDGWEGVGNIDADPLFMDPENDDFSLQNSSPCNDAGNPNLWFSDIDGTSSDMGATGGSNVLPNFISHDFGEVGDLGSSKQFNLYNYRETAITITSVNFNTNSFSTNTTSPTTIEPLQTGIINIEANNSVLGFSQDEMVLVSEDLSQGIFVSLSVTGTEDNVLSGNLSGTYAAITYRISGDLTIASSNTVILEAGTEFLFDGEYDFNIYGTLEAIGTEADSIIFDNFGDEKWRGFTLHEASDETVFKYVRISGSQKGLGGGMRLNSSNASLSHVVIISNISSSYGGGIYMSSSSPTLEHVTVSGNSTIDLSGIGYSPPGGGIALDQSNPTLNHVIIAENTAMMGAGIYFVNCNNSTLNNVTISGNTGLFFGGGVALDYSHPTLNHVTISGNTGGFSGGGIYLNQSNPQIINSIIWGNSAGMGDPQIGIGNNGPSTPLITYSNIEGGFPGGDENIDANPIFSDAENGDFSLQEGSPCIDSGTADLDGDGVEDITDYLGFAPDMGAFEFGAVYGCTDPEAINFDPEANMDDGSCEYSSGPSEILVTYNTDWNLVGLPLSVEDATYSNLFPEAIIGTLYSYDVAYVSESYLTSGAGYWLRFNDAGSTTITGSTINELSINLSEGWNLISGISETVSIFSISDPDGIIVSGTLYGYDVAYVPSEELLAGKGYWLRAYEDGEITLTSGALAKVKPYNFSLTGKANSLTINDMELYFGVEMSPRQILSYGLPPKPPSGAFDIRFKGDTRIAGDNTEIEIMSPYEIITISYDVLLDAGEHMNWILTSESGEEYTLESTGEITIPTEETFTLERKAIIPIVYTLHQNYPNPFNPITSLRYDLPEQAQVTLTVYDLMGREITQLVNITQKAGYRSVQWNATNSFGKPVSAGVYLYQIRAGEFVQTRKMVLLK